MNQVIAVSPNGDYKLSVTFSDGFIGELDVIPFIKGGISEKLRAPDFFNTVKIDEFGGIFWANGFDFCPNFLYEYLHSTQNY
jgi:hypothetical protein